MFGQLAVLQQAFPTYPAHPITVLGALHLKSVVSLAAPGHLVAVDSAAGRDVVGSLERVAVSKYAIHLVPDAPAANVVHVNGTLFVPADCPQSTAVLRERLLESVSKNG